MAATMNLEAALDRYFRQKRAERAAEKLRENEMKVRAFIEANFPADAEWVLMYPCEGGQS